MRNDTTDDAPGSTRHAETFEGQWTGRPPAAGATVSIPSRSPARTPFSSATLHARLALLRPQPLRLRPAPRDDA